MATLFEMEPLGESGLKVNDAQRRAITHGEGPLLVIAGAGTGKTRVIMERIRHLLQSDETLSGENIRGLHQAAFHLTRVFPVPAPAITSSGPSPCVIARLCASLSFSPLSPSGSISNKVAID